MALLSIAVGGTLVEVTVDGAFIGAEQDVRLREKLDERAGLADALRHVIHLVLVGRQRRIGRGLRGVRDDVSKRLLLQTGEAVILEETVGRIIRRHERVALHAEVANLVDAPQQHCVGLQYNREGQIGMVGALPDFILHHADKVGNGPAAGPKSAALPRQRAARVGQVVRASEQIGERVHHFKLHVRKVIPSDIGRRQDDDLAVRTVVVHHRGIVVSGGGHRAEDTPERRLGHNLPRAVQHLRLGSWHVDVGDHIAEYVVVARLERSGLVGQVNQRGRLANRRPWEVGQVGGDVGGPAHLPRHVGLEDE